MTRQPSGKTLASGSQGGEESQKKTSSSRRGKSVNDPSDDSSGTGFVLALQQPGVPEGGGVPSKKREGKGKKRRDLSNSRSGVDLKSEISLPERDERASGSADADPDEKFGTTAAPQVGEEAPKRKRGSWSAGGEHTSESADADPDEKFGKAAAPQVGEEAPKRKRGSRSARGEHTSESAGADPDEKIGKAASPQVGKEVPKSKRGSRSARGGRTSGSADADPDEKFGKAASPQVGEEVPTSKKGSRSARGGHTPRSADADPDEKFGKAACPQVGGEVPKSKKGGRSARGERDLRSADADPDEKFGTPSASSQVEEEVRKSKKGSRSAKGVDRTNALDAGNKSDGTGKRKRKCLSGAGGEGIDSSSRATDGEEGVVALEESSRERDGHALHLVSDTGEGAALEKTEKRKKKKKACTLPDDSGPNPKIHAPRGTDADPYVEIDKVSEMNSSAQVKKAARRSKKERHSAGSVDQPDALDDRNVTEERKFFSSSVTDLVSTGGKGLDSSPRATDATVTENIEAMDHTGDRAVPKERKRRKKPKACLDGPNNALLNDSGLDLKSESSPPGKDDCVSRSEHTELHVSANINSLSPEASKGQTRIKTSRKKREKEVREGSSRPTLVENINEEPTENTSSLVSKKDTGLSTDASNSSLHSHPGFAINSSSHDKKKASSKRNRKDLEGKDVIKTTDVSSDSKKDNDTTNCGCSVISSREDGLIGTVDIDAGRKADSLPVVNSNFDGVVDTSSEGIRKRRKKNNKSAVNPEPCPSLDVSSTSSSLVPDTVEIVKQETDRTSNCFICPSPIRGVIDNLPSTDIADKPDSCLHSFENEDGSFSFQVTDHSKSSVICSENTCQLGSEIRYDNGPSTGQAENALDSMPTCILNEMNNGQREKNVPSSSVSDFAVISSDSNEVEDNKPNAAPMPHERTLATFTGKKLLVLDLNGLLADIVLDTRNRYNTYKVAGKAVFKRPFCDDFLRFCFERFDIGVWSSRKGYNVTSVVDYVMGDAKHKLRFCWDLSRCTTTGFKTIDNADKPLVLKELKKLWNKEDPDLPWEKGEYSPTNTLLIDDSPYKAICNPPHTAIFPWPYRFKNRGDFVLGQRGALRVYLEGLAVADNVQQYVQQHPFGQRAITASHPSWKFYLEIINKVEGFSVSHQ